VWFGLGELGEKLLEGSCLHGIKDRSPQFHIHINIWFLMRIIVIYVAKGIRITLWRVMGLLRGVQWGRPTVFITVFLTRLRVLTLTLIFLIAAGQLFSAYQSRHTILGVDVFTAGQNFFAL
jgi:hypothetical protein